MSFKQKYPFCILFGLADQDSYSVKKSLLEKLKYASAAAAILIIAILYGLSNQDSPLTFFEKEKVDSVQLEDIFIQSILSNWRPFMVKLRSQTPDGLEYSLECDNTTSCTNFGPVSLPFNTIQYDQYGVLINTNSLIQLDSLDSHITLIIEGEVEGQYGMLVSIGDIQSSTFSPQGKYQCRLGANSFNRVDFTITQNRDKKGVVKTSRNYMVQSLQIPMTCNSTITPYVCAQNMEIEFRVGSLMAETISEETQSQLIWRTVADVLSFVSPVLLIAGFLFNVVITRTVWRNTPSAWISHSIRESILYNGNHGVVTTTNSKQTDINNNNNNNTNNQKVEEKDIQLGEI